MSKTNKTVIIKPCSHCGRFEHKWDCPNLCDNAPAPETLRVPGRFAYLELVKNLEAKKSVAERLEDQERLNLRLRMILCHTPISGGVA